MASAAMEAEVNAALAAGASSLQYSAAVAAIKARLGTGDLSVLALVQSMRSSLTSSEDDELEQGISFLSEIIEECKLNPSDLHQIALFLTSKLADRRTTVAAVAGCLKLIKRPDFNLLEPNISRKILDAFIGNVQLQELPYKHRKECLQFWLAALEAVAKLYSEPGVNRQAFSLGAEELFDVISCYFPVSFTASDEGKVSITKDQMAAALHATMACAPEFATSCIPLVLEKLSSPTRQAKMDALSLLHSCCKTYAREALKNHLQAVWLALKQELCAPLSMYDLTATELKDKIAVMRQTSDVLTHVIRNLGMGTMDTLALAHSSVLHVLEMREKGSLGTKERDVDHDIGKSVACVAEIVGAVAAAVPASCLKVCKEYLKPFLTTNLQLLESQFSPATFTKMMCITHGILKKVGENCLTKAWVSMEDEHAMHDVACLLLKALSFTYWRIEESLIGQTVPETVLADETNHKSARDSISDEYESQFWSLIIWQDLLGLPDILLQIPQSDMEQCFIHLMASAFSKSQVKVSLKFDWGRETDVQSEAFIALRLVSRLHWHKVPWEVVEEHLTKPMIARPTSRKQAFDAMEIVAQNNDKGAATLFRWLADCIADMVSQFVETFTEDQNPTTLSACMQFLLDRLFPCVHVPLEDDLSKWISTFAYSLVFRWKDTQKIQNKTTLEPILCKSARCIMKLLSHCHIEDQKDVANAAIQCIEQTQNAGFSKQNGSHFQGNDINLGLVYPLACSVIASLHRGVVTSRAAETLTVKILDNSLSEWATQNVSSISAFALAAILNKEREMSVVDGCSKIILERCNNLVATGTMEQRRICILELVCHGLALRSYSGMTDFVDSLIRVITSMPTTAYLRGRSQRLAAKAFSTIVSSDSSLEYAAQSLECHFQSSILWQQRAFQSCQFCLIAARDKSGATSNVQHGVNAAVNKSDEAVLNVQSLRLGYGYLVASVPLQICKASCTNMVGTMADGLAVLVELNHEDDKLADLLLRNLDCAMNDEEITSAIPDQIPSLLPTLLHLIQHSRNVAIRLASLQVTKRLFGAVPYSSVYPFRQKVLLALSSAIDDNKRIVRQEAIIVKNAWNDNG